MQQLLEGDAVRCHDMCCRKLGLQAQEGVPLTTAKSKALPDSVSARAILTGARMHTPHRASQGSPPQRGTIDAAQSTALLEESPAGARHLR